MKSRLTLNKKTFHTGFANFYLIGASVLVLFYLISPAISYAIVMKIIPKLPLTIIFATLLIITFTIRIYLLLHGKMPIRGKLFIGTLFLLVWITLIQATGLLDANILKDLEVFGKTLGLVCVAAWILFLGGEAFAYCYNNLKSLIVGSYLLLLATVIIGVWLGWVNFGQLFFLFKNYSSDELYNYLALGDSLAIIGLFVLGIFHNKPRMFIITYLITMVVLFMSYSRTSLFVFFIASFVYFLRIQKIKSKIVTWTGVLVLTLMFGLPIYLLDDFGANLHILDITLSRITSIICGEDLSLQGRLELLSEFPSLVNHYGVLGKFLYEISDGYGRGAYIHNWLSFWLEYGFFPFILSSILTISLFVMRFRTAFLNMFETTRFTIIFLAFMAIMISRSYVWPYYWFALSFTAVKLPLTKGR